MADQQGPEPPSTGDPVRDYVRANLKTMTREGIRERLVAAGHDPKRIDEVWEQEWTGVRPASTERALWTEAVALFIGGALFGGLGALALAGLLVGYGGSVIAFLGLFAVAYVVLGLAIAFAVRWAARARRISGGWALLIGIVLVPVYGGLMLGTCLAAASLTSA